MSTPPGETDDQFVASARSALRSTSPSEALRTLGWAEMLPHLQDAEARRALFAVFRAQGRELVSTGAIGLLMAYPYLPDDSADIPVAVMARESPRTREVRNVILSVPQEGQLLVDLPGQGAYLIEVSAATMRPVDLPGEVGLHEVEVDLSSATAMIEEERAAVSRRRSLWLGRTAMAFDLLGAAEAALELTVEYAFERKQFGLAIGRFQAVRHLLAWARVDCAGISSVADQMVELDDLLPATYDQVLKAVAGRNSRRACQRTLQVLGGIGFTAEHRHHHFYSRVLALDSLLGSSVSLAHGLASGWRAAATDLPVLTIPVVTNTPS